MQPMQPPCPRSRSRRSECHPSLWAFGQRTGTAGTETTQPGHAFLMLSARHLLCASTQVCLIYGCHQQACGASFMTQAHPLGPSVSYGTAPHSGGADTGCYHNHAGCMHQPSCMQPWHAAPEPHLHNMLPYAAHEQVQNDSPCWFPCCCNSAACNDAADASQLACADGSAHGQLGIGLLLFVSAEAC